MTGVTARRCYRIPKEMKQTTNKNKKQQTTDRGRLTETSLLCKVLNSMQTKTTLQSQTIQNSFLNSQKRLSRPLSNANWDKQEEPLKEEQQMEMEEEDEDEAEEVKRVFRPLQLLTACFGALRYLIQLLRFGKIHHV